MLAYNLCFSGSNNQVSWYGKQVIDGDVFRTYVSSAVYARLNDAEYRQSFEADLQALATTSMATDTLRTLLEAHTDQHPWEVGEALAEAVLEHEHHIQWPWNMERDKRTPKASLPGADMVGFLEVGDEVWLVLGEVKTSEDLNTPPNVMNGRGGIIH